MGDGHLPASPQGVPGSLENSRGTEKHRYVRQGMNDHHGGLGCGSVAKMSYTTTTLPVTPPPPYNSTIPPSHIPLHTIIHVNVARTSKTRTSRHGPLLLVHQNDLFAPSHTHKRQNPNEAHICTDTHQYLTHAYTPYCTYRNEGPYHLGSVLQGSNHGQVPARQEHTAQNQG